MAVRLPSLVVGSYPPGIALWATTRLSQKATLPGSYSFVSIFISLTRRRASRFLPISTERLGHRLHADVPGENSECELILGP